MNSFHQPIQLRWADIDANRHLRHSVYYDFGASVRMRILTELGLSASKLESIKIGPILFREEMVFKREILLDDYITIETELVKATEDYSRWSFRHRYLKNGETVAAILTVDGAWIDLEKRKLIIPEEWIAEIFHKIPKSADFTVIPPKEPKIQ